MVTVRNLRADEKLPSHFRTGYENMPIMGDWCWLAEEDGKALGALLAAPAHGVLYLMRLYTIDGAPTNVATSLLLTCLSDAANRGYQGFLTYVNPMREQEGKLMMIAELWGGFQAPELQVAIAGPMRRDGWKNIPRHRILEMF